MAIAKIIYKSSAEDTGTVWLDTTQKTVTAASMLNGTTALKNDGTDITGSIASKTSSDLTANVLTVTAPAGHYASNATKTLSDQNLVAGNIKKDVSIFGVTGSYEGGGSATLITKSITANGTYNASSDNADGYSQVTVNVSGGGSYPWYGANAELVDTRTMTFNLANDTTWSTWLTGTGIASSILAAPSENDFSYTFDATQYVCIVTTRAFTKFNYVSGKENTGIIVANGNVYSSYLYGGLDKTCSVNSAQSLSTGYFSYGLYYSSFGILNALTGNYGVYAYTNPTITLSYSSGNITINYKRSPIYARTTSSFMTMDNAAYVDADNTNIVFEVKTYRVPRTNIFFSKTYEEIVDMCIDAV